MNYPLVYQIIYSLAALNGREGALFGKSAPLAQEAFAHSVACDAFPELWFELPLAGEPWFDLHALTSRSDLQPGMTFSAERTGGYPLPFEWFAQQKDVRQLALSWDVGSRGATSPAIQLLMGRRNLDESSAFFDVVGRPEAISGYRTFVKGLPQGWFACYAGTFPNRADAPLRVECIPTPEQQKAYAHDVSLLEADLRHVGLTDLGDTLLPRCQQLAATPYQLEFQFDITSEGTAGRTFGASVRFAPPTKGDLPKTFDPSREAGPLMEAVESWGLADERWRLLQITAFSKRVSMGDESLLLFCFPAFIKLRWRDGAPVDAKTYLMAGAQ